MVRHIILWTLRPELSESEKNKIKADIKRELEEFKEIGIPRSYCIVMIL